MTFFGGVYVEISAAQVWGIETGKHSAALFRSATPTATSEMTDLLSDPNSKPNMGWQHPFFMLHIPGEN